MEKVTKKLKLIVGIKEEEGIKLPMYKNIPYEKEFIKMYRVMEIMFTRLNKVELLLHLFLVKNCKEDGVVYNNGHTKQSFIEYVSGLSKGELKYKNNTIDHAFSSLREQGVIVKHELIPTAYWVNPAFLHIGSEHCRNRVFVDIDSQEFRRDMKLQKELRIEQELINQE